MFTTAGTSTTKAGINTNSNNKRTHTPNNILDTSISLLSSPKKKTCTKKGNDNNFDINSNNKYDENEKENHLNFIDDSLIKNHNDIASEDNTGDTIILNQDVVDEVNDVILKSDDDKEEVGEDDEKEQDDDESTGPSYDELVDQMNDIIHSTMNLQQTTTNIDNSSNGQDIVLVYNKNDITTIPNHDNKIIHDITIKYFTGNKVADLKTIAALRYKWAQQTAQLFNRKVPSGILYNIIHQLETKCHLPIGTINESTIRDRVRKNNLNGHKPQSLPPLHDLELILIIMCHDKKLDMNHEILNIKNKNQICNMMGHLMKGTKYEIAYRKLLKLPVSTTNTTTTNTSNSNTTTTITSGTTTPPPPPPPPMITIPTHAWYKKFMRRHQDKFEYLNM